MKSDHIGVIKNHLDCYIYGVTRSRILVALLVSLSLMAAPSFAAVKAGAKCTKAGTTATTSGKKFTCVKSGNKLVWNKGVAVKAAPKPTPNPVFKPVEPTPTATPTPSPTATPTPTPSVKPVEFNATAKKAFDIIQAAKIQSSNLTYTYRIGTFAAPDVAKVVQGYVENAAQIYSLFLESPRVVTIHVFTEKDMPALSDSTFFTNQTGLKFFTDWWSKDESQINASYGALGTFYNSECSVSTNQCTGPAGHAGAAYPSRATALTLDQHSLSVPSHELFHVMQDFYRFNGKPQYLVTEEVKDFSMRPVFREGGATFMALSSSLTDFAQYEDGMNFYKNWAAKEFAADIKGLNSPEDVVSLLVKLERLDRSARLYGLGTFLHEWLIANHGLDKFISLTKKHNVGKEFNELFTEIYGMSLKDAYTKAAPHILERVKG
jgi:hypothetical protein